MIEQEIQSVLWETSTSSYEEKFLRFTSLIIRVRAIPYSLFPDENTFGFSLGYEYSHGYGFGHESGSDAVSKGGYGDTFGHGSGDGSGYGDDSKSGYGLGKGYGRGYVSGSGDGGE